MTKHIHLITGDCRKVLKRMPNDTIDSLVTDPPAGINFMGFDFDSDRGGRDKWIEWLTEPLRECFRILKPGAHALVWALPRTCHWTATALENSGFEIRDSIHHHFGIGMPKGLSIDKAIDKIKGAKRKVIAVTKRYRCHTSSVWQKSGFNSPVIKTTLPSSHEARHWAGWNSSLKPGHEVWWLCRRPIAERSIAHNVLRWGTGAVNVGACRTEVGRWPANAVMTHAPDCRKRGAKSIQGNRQWAKDAVIDYSDATGQEVVAEWECVPSCPVKLQGDKARYFPTFAYFGKASAEDRNDNPHPTVKNTELMRWLCRLITPNGGTVLDPFTGSGGTAIACQMEGFGFIGIEKDREYVSIARRRLKRAKGSSYGLSL